MPLTKCKAESLDLTANYTFTGDVTLASGGSLNLISTQTASSSASISFTTGIDSTYDEYWFILNNIHPQTNGTTLEFQTTTDGSNFNITTTSSFFQFRHKENDTTYGLEYEGGSDQAQGTSFQHLSATVLGDSDSGCSGILKLYNPSSTTFVKHYVSQIVHPQSSGSQMSELVAGYFNTTSAITGIRFKYSSGNTDDGTIQMFGVSQ
jgi:hypothetical protein